MAILDADIEGFLRDSRSLIQTIGRAARNVEGRAILYADRITRSMETCINETNRRREVQIAYNEQHGITPETIHKNIQEIEFSTRVADVQDRPVSKVSEPIASYADEANTEEYIKILEQEMVEAAEAMNFERAAIIRDQVFDIKATLE